MSYSPVFAALKAPTRWTGWRRQIAELREMRPVADRAKPVLEEWSVDLAPGRELVLPAEEQIIWVRVRAPKGPPVPCKDCWGQRRLWESGILGLVPIVCERCAGSGRDPL